MSLIIKNDWLHICFVSNVIKYLTSLHKTSIYFDEQLKTCYREKYLKDGNAILTLEEKENERHR